VLLQPRPFTRLFHRFAVPLLRCAEEE
jgi:hypothetical protein